MALDVSTITDLSAMVEWMWQSNLNPWSKTEQAEWSFYSVVENLIVEEAYKAKQTNVILDEYYIDLKNDVQVSNNNVSNQRRVKRMVCKRDYKHLREGRFMPNPITPSKFFNGQCGWVSPFILEVVKDLNLRHGHMPAQDETVIPKIVEQAALGIIEEGKNIGKQCEAEHMAKKLMERKEKGMLEVWKCCAFLYSMDSFLYKKLNECMRLVGDLEHDIYWRSKVRTLGPFALLLWDNPLNNQANMSKQKLYRGAYLTDVQIATCIEFSQRQDVYGSLQAFTSCSRNKELAQIFGNVLLVMEAKLVFTVDISPFSNLPEEEEELVSPGVCCIIQRVEYDNEINKFLFYIELEHRFNQSGMHEIPTDIDKLKSDEQSDSGACAEIRGVGNSFYYDRLNKKTFLTVGTPTEDDSNVIEMGGGDGSWTITLHGFSTDIIGGDGVHFGRPLNAKCSHVNRYGEFQMSDYDETNNDN